MEGESTRAIARRSETHECVAVAVRKRLRAGSLVVVEYIARRREIDAVAYRTSNRQNNIGGYRGNANENKGHGA